MSDTVHPKDYMLLSETHSPVVASDYLTEFTPAQRAQIDTYTERREAAWLERFNQYRRRAAIGFCCLLLGCLYMGAELYATIHRVDKSSQNQLDNRVKNVGTWCTAINEVIDADRATLEHFKIEGVFTLEDLNCIALEQKTLESPH